MSNYVGGCHIFRWTSKMLKSYMFVLVGQVQLCGALKNLLEKSSKKRCRIWKPSPTPRFGFGQLCGLRVGSKVVGFRQMGSSFFWLAGMGTDGRLRWLGEAFDEGMEHCAFSRGDEMSFINFVPETFAKKNNEQVGWSWCPRGPKSCEHVLLYTYWDTLW